MGAALLDAGHRVRRRARPCCAADRQLALAGNASARTLTPGRRRTGRRAAAAPELLAGGAPLGTSVVVTANRTRMACPGEGLGGHRLGSGAQVVGGHLDAGVLLEPDDLVDRT